MKLLFTESAWADAGFIMKSEEASAEGQAGVVKGCAGKGMLGIASLSPAYGIFSAKGVIHGLGWSDQ